MRPKLQRFSTPCIYKKIIYSSQIFLFVFGIINQSIGQASFTVPDTVCVGSTVNITNTTVGASSYYWNFCVANINNPPAGTNLGNVGNELSAPVYIDYVYDNGNYYGFLTNNWPGALLRLNFGNSLLNTPTVTDLGTVGGVIPNNTEGVQIVKNENKWYVIIVGGDPVGGTSSRIVKIELGTSITNNSPVGTNWGNIGNLLYPHDLYVFDDNGQWYGLTVNTDNNTITRFNFTSSFSNTPTAVNLGNIGNLDGPTGVFAIKENGNWHAFVTNYKSSTLTRLNFGTSLLNTPTGTNLGNVGGTFHQVWDIHIMQYCGKTLGYAINAQSGYSDIVKLDFGNNITNTPTAESFGNIGSLSFPHAISKIFRVGPDLYSFIPSVGNNSLSRIRFTGCNNSNIPNSNLQNPPPVNYNSPGVYNIFLGINDGLSTQESTCRQVVVVPPPVKSPVQNFTLCTNANIKIGSPVKPATYNWNTGSTSDSIVVTSPGTYWVESNRFGCSVRDSFIVTAATSYVDFSFNINPCNPKNVKFYSSFGLLPTLTWNFGDGQINTTNPNPEHTYSSYGNYNVTLTIPNNSGCGNTITRNINISAALTPGLILNADTSICPGDSVFVKTSSNTWNSCWTTNMLSDDSGFYYVKPLTNTTYTFHNQHKGPNLLINGNFESGNTGFTSQYAYNPSSGLIPGVYNVGSSVSSWNNNLSNCQGMSGAGNMLMVNGADQSYVNIWSQNISIQPNTNYLIYTHLQNLSSVNPVQVQFAINGIPLGNSFAVNNPNCEWYPYSVMWNSGNLTSAEVSLMNMNNIAGGKDFALDDMFFGTIIPQVDYVTVSVGNICDSLSIAGPQTICSLQDTITYTIYKENCNQNFSVVVDNAYADVISVSQNQVKVKFKQEGNTTVKIAINNSCLSVADSVSVDIKLSPDVINLGPDLVACSDTSLLLHAGPGFASYQWQNLTSDSILQVNAPGTYIMQAQNYCGETFIDSFVYTKVFPSVFTVSPLNATVCSGDSLLFQASGGDQYAWSPATNFGQPFNSSSQALINGTQQFLVSITDNLCNRDTLIFIQVTATDKAEISINKTNDVNCSTDTALLKVSGGTSYTWLPNPYIIRTQNGQVTVKPPTTTTFYVKGVNALGCSGEDSVTVEFTKTGQEKLYMPNAFTPNNDGLNDIYKAAFIGPAQKFDFRIFNRWGELVFRSNTPGKGWDGRYKGHLQAGDVFVYYITAEGGCEGEFTQKGTFILIR